MGMDPKKVWSEIERVVSKTIFAGEAFITNNTNKLLKFRKTAFHLFGFDILLDGDFKPWVLEVNHVPSMAPHTKLENEISLKNFFLHFFLNIFFYLLFFIFTFFFLNFFLEINMLKDMYNLVDILNNDKSEIYRKSDELWEMLENKIKEANVDVSQQQKSFERFELNNLLHITKQDLWCLVDYEFERKRVNNWKMLFPTSDQNAYHKFAMKNRNFLLISFIKNGWDLEKLEEMIKKL